MKTFILALALLSPSAFAMPSTLGMTCEQASDVVAANGAIVLGTGGYTYDRFVTDIGYCDMPATTAPAYVPTADSAQCFIGYRCVQDNRGNGGA